MKNSLIVVFCALLALACEKEFVPDEIEASPELVVEGYIEASTAAPPPYVVLTRSTPFFADLAAEGLADLFVHNATVVVSDGVQRVELTEVCLDQLTEEQRELAATFLGQDFSSLGFNYCVYLDLTQRMQGQEGKTYTLTVEAGEWRAQAVTTIPVHVPLDSLRFDPPPGEPNDTLAQLKCYINDPAGQPDYYRYMTGVNDQGVMAPQNSVIDDRLFDGQGFEFPLSKAEDPNEDFDFATFGLFSIGDTLQLKWQTIDQQHFDFWNTLEFNAANQGPFSSYTLIQSNVEGGLGIWGGLSASYYELPVQVEE